MSILDHQTSLSTTLDDGQQSHLRTTGGDVPEKSISEKVAEARRKRKESTPIQRLLSRNNTPTMTPTSVAHLISPKKGGWGPKAHICWHELRAGTVNVGDHSSTSTNERTIIDHSSITNGEDNDSGNASSSDGHRVDPPKVQRRADSTTTFRRGRSLFRSSAPKVRRHARPPFLTTSKIEEETSVVLPLRRRESVSPKPRRANGKRNPLSRGGHQHKP